MTLRPAQCRCGHAWHCHHRNGPCATHTVHGWDNHAKTFVIDRPCPCDGFEPERNGTVMV